MNSSFSFFGLPFSVVSLPELVSLFTEETKTAGIAYHLVNSYTLSVAERSSRLHLLLKENVLICDGKPLAKLLERKNSKLKQIRGADLMREVLRQESSNARHFFLGSSDQVLEKLNSFGKNCNSSITIAGSFAPEFKEHFDDHIPAWARMINESGATIVWVGLGTPKQDYVAHEIARNVPVHVIAVGAAFDYLAGNLAESPKFLQVLGLEWLFRLIKEPKRLTRRYLVGNYRFLLICMREIWAGK